MARVLYGLEHPSVGLLNIGVEEVKGLEEVREAGRILREAQLPFLDYTGFIEADAIGLGEASSFDQRDAIHPKQEIVHRLAELAGADLIGASVGGAFAAEMAAIFPASVRRLALIAPFGLFDETDPAADPWAQRKDAVAKLMCADGARWEAMVSPPEGANSVEWPIEMTRAAEAAARAFWPLGNTRLEKRLGLIVAPTLVLWGEKDAIQPPSYAAKFAKGIGGATKVQSIPGAGHLAYLDQPEAVARAILAHLA